MKTNEDKTDQRKIKNRVVLAKALMEMMRTIELEDIKVSALCRKCHVSRATFYNNFSSIHEVIEFYIKNKFADLEKAVKLESKKRNMSLVEQYDFMVHKMVTDSYSSGRILKDILGRKNKGEFCGVMFLFFEKYIEAFMEEEASLQYTAEKRKLLSHAWAGSLTGVVYCISHNSNSYTKEELENAIRKASRPLVLETDNQEE